MRIAGPARAARPAIWRRVAALVLLLAPFQGSAVAWAAQDTHERGCHDHVCACTARHCPPKKPAGHCHGESGGLQLVPGACHHPQAAIGPTVLRPHVVPEPAALEPPDAATARLTPRDPSLHAGFREIDLPPPRRLS
jgi:hypothetical protein